MRLSGLFLVTVCALSFFLPQQAFSRGGNDKHSSFSCTAETQEFSQSLQALKQAEQRVRYIVTMLANPRLPWSVRSRLQSQLKAAQKAVEKAKKAVKKAKEKLDKCHGAIGSRCVPGSDPGMCLRCLNGQVVPDNSEDPGMCLSCSGGVAVADNSEYPGACLRCQQGQAVYDNGITCNDGDDCTKGDKCSNGVCKPGSCTCPPSPSGRCYKSCAEQCGW